ncbi:MAG: LapA family protein [Firmicutes bacterium]|nr:LapA family protein [Bacillota bacterium]
MLLLAAALVILAVVAVFASQNAHLVAVNFLAWRFTWPLAGIVLVTLAAGALLVFLVLLGRQLGLRLKMHDTAGRLTRAERDLAAARAELEKARATLADRERQLGALRLELGNIRTELEEARRLVARQAGTPAGRSEPDVPAKGGGPGGEGDRRS